MTCIERHCPIPVAILAFLMKRNKPTFGRGFQVVLGNKQSQAAQMTLPAGESEGGPHNRHVGSDQWLFVVSGHGVAVINRKKYPLTEGTLLLIERGDLHEIRNTGKRDLKTLSFYVPPAYSSDGDELPAGKSER
jgi:mannose-6-phosphate isomerase-like protein (cupin superfamily)